MTNLIAACGLDCSKCEAYLATQANDQVALQQIAEKWRVEYHNPAITSANIICDGCMAGGRTMGHCSECAIRLCAVERGLENCAACPDYSCDKLTGFLKMVPQAQANLELLRNN